MDLRLSKRLGARRTGAGLDTVVRGHAVAVGPLVGHRRRATVPGIAVPVAHEGDQHGPVDRRRDGGTDDRRRRRIGIDDGRSRAVQSIAAGQAASIGDAIPGVPERGGSKAPGPIRAFPASPFPVDAQIERIGGVIVVSPGDQRPARRYAVGRAGVGIDAHYQQIAVLDAGRFGDDDIAIGICAAGSRGYAVGGAKGNRHVSLGS